MMQNKKIIAVTGGIGCGKSEVCAVIAGEGYPVFSCDDIYASLTSRRGFLTERLEKAFGGVLRPDGSLDRKELASRVFSDPSARKKLEDITHPAIMAELLERAKAANSSTVFCEVPLLFENGYERLFDGIIVVTRALRERVKAVKARSGLSEEQIYARIGAQCNYSSLDLSGCYVMDNCGDKAELRKKVIKILQNIT